MSVYRVQLAAAARESIEDEWRLSAASPARGNETGGWLWSPQGAGWWGLDGIDVQEASGPGPDSMTGYGEMSFSLGYLYDLDELFRREGLELCGGWHTHPHGEDQPSSRDDDRIHKVLDMRATRECRTQRALEIIFTPREYGGGWKAQPWVFDRGPSRFDEGRTILHPEGAVLVSEGGRADAHFGV